jgi:MFS family permease
MPSPVLGPRRIFLAGIILVGVGGLAGGFAQDLITLLISRVLIGLGTSCVSVLDGTLPGKTGS